MNSSRQRILRSCAKVRLIEGEPGVGKTWFGCELAQHELDNLILGVQPHQKILFLTFARNAVARIRQVFTKQGFADRTRAKAFAQRVRVDTFCGFFWWLVECYGRYAKDGTTRRLWLIGSKDIPGAPVPEGHEGFTFDKIETNALKLVRITAVRRLISDVYPLVIVDEFQDVHDRLFDILEALAKRSRLVLLRGPGQCIYRRLPGREFDPTRIWQKCIMRLGAVPFRLHAIDDNKQRYSQKIRTFIGLFSRGNVPQCEILPVRFRALPKENTRGNPNSLETFAAIELRDMKKWLTAPGSRCAILASTNEAVVRIGKKLREGTHTYQLAPQSNSLIIGDNILLQYGRLMLQLLRSHWIAAKAEQVEPRDVAVLLVLLFQDQDKTAHADPGAWAEFAQVLMDKAHGQQEPASSCGWQSRLERNLSTLNEMLRATQKKQRKQGIHNCQPTPFDKEHSALLESLRDEFIVSIKRNVNAHGRVDIEKAAISFEKANQRKVIFEKLGIQKNVQVMTIHKSKGREFDGVVLVLEDSQRAIWRKDSNARDEEIEDIYRVAISRARSAFALVAFENAWKDAAAPVRRLLPESLFHRDS